jgi:LacI family transcriptional regulator
MSRGLKNLTTFRFEESEFAVARETSFFVMGKAAGARLCPGWWLDDASPPRSQEDPSAIIGWLNGLPKPCGIFACTDSWARVVARYVRIAGYRIPEDLAVVGVDNDTTECEITSPGLSSVAIPWRQIGQTGAQLVQQALEGKDIAGKRIVVSPGEVVKRRSTEIMAIEDELVAASVAWIYEHADCKLTVPSVASAVGTTRQRLERRFRSVLGRTVMHEVRRAHVETAKRLLSTTSASITEIAKMSGFKNPAFFSVTFKSETGTSPAAYRRQFSGPLADDD